MKAYEHHSWSWDIDGATIRGLAAKLPAQIYQEGALRLAESEHFAKWSRNSQKETTIEAAVRIVRHISDVSLIGKVLAFFINRE